MKMRRAALGVAILGLLAIAGAVWRWLTAPAPPDIPLHGIDPLMVEAIRKGTETVRRQPRSAEAWGELGMLLAVNAFFKPAETCLRHAQRLEPSNPHWHYVSGMMWQMAGDTRRAAADMQHALELAREPLEVVAIRFRLAQLLIEDGEVEAAEPLVRALETTESDVPRATYLRALFALTRGDRAAAGRHLRDLTEVSFCRKRVHVLLASIAADSQTAQQLSETAERLPPDSPWPDPIAERMHSLRVDRMQRLATFTALKEQGRSREAIEFLRPLAARQPDREVCFALAMELFDQGEFEEAEKNFRLAITYEPNNIRSHFLLGSCLLYRGEKLMNEPGKAEAAAELFRQAIAAEDQALKLHAENGLAHYTRGLALKYLGRTDEALAALRQAVLIYPEFSTTQLALGEALAEAGRLDEGLEHLRYAVQFARPNDPKPAAALQKWQAKANRQK